MGKTLAGTNTLDLKFMGSSMSESTCNPGVLLSYLLDSDQDDQVPCSQVIVRRITETVA